jgi:hypothetical protein
VSLTSSRRFALRQFAQLDIAELNRETVVLQEDVAVVGFSEAGVNVVLTVGDDGAEGWGFAVVLDDLDPVEPVLAVGSADDDAGGVPFADGMRGLVCGGRNHVIQRGDGAVAVFTQFRVRVSSIVEDLIFEADVGAVALVAGCVVQVDEVLDAGVRARCDAEVNRELEVAVFARGDDVARVAAFFAAGLGHGNHAVPHFPTRRWEGIGTCAAPAGAVLAIEEQLPACRLLGGSERVGGLSGSGLHAQNDSSDEKAEDAHGRTIRQRLCGAEESFEAVVHVLLNMAVEE